VKQIYKVFERKMQLNARNAWNEVFLEEKREDYALHLKSLFENI
jgi:hypothetical protein